MSPAYEQPAGKPLQRAVQNTAAGVPTRGGAALSKVAQGASTVFGRPSQERPADLEPRVGVNPNSYASQLASTVFGTPRHKRPAEPERPAQSSNPNSKAAQLVSTALPASQHMRLAESENTNTTTLANANSHVSQLSSTSLPQGEHKFPPPQEPPHRPAHALSTVAQNTSHSCVFGPPRYLEPPSPGAVLSQAEDGTSKCFAPGEWVLPTPRSSREGAPRTKAAMQVSTSMPCTRHRSAPPSRAREVLFPGDDPRLRVRRRPEDAAGDIHGVTAGYEARPHSTGEMLRSTVFGAPRHLSPPPQIQSKQGAPAGWNTRSGYNSSAVFPGQSKHEAPPMPAKEPRAYRAPASKTEQLESSGVGGLLGSPRVSKPTDQESARNQRTSNAFRGPRYFEDDAAGLAGTPRRSQAAVTRSSGNAPTPRSFIAASDDGTAGQGGLAPTSKAAQLRSSGVGGALGATQHPSAMANVAPLRLKTRLHDLNNPSLLNSEGFKRGPSDAKEGFQDNAAHATGHARIEYPTKEAVMLSRSYLKIEFDGLPPETTSHRLHEALSTLPYKPSVNCARSKVQVQYGGLEGMATGKGEAYLTGVPNDDHVHAAISEAQARGYFGSKGGRLAEARVKLDGRVRV